MHRRLLHALSLVAVLGSGSGCSSSAGEASSDASEDDGGAGCGVAFCPVDASGSDAPVEIQVKEVIDHVCAGSDCHGTGAGNMAVSVGNEFTDMVNVDSSENTSMLRVKPFDPDHSYVYLKLACDAGPIVGACMPASNPSPFYADLFRSWIEAGAPTD